MDKKDFISLVRDAINNFEIQGEFSRNVSGGCFYNNRGLRCIVGWMMPDDISMLADTQVESGILDLTADCIEWTKQFNKEQIDVLNWLQGYHDHSKDVTDAVAKMKHVIEDYERYVE